MPPSPGLSDVRALLLRKGVRPDYVDRLLEELRDHRQDLIEDLVCKGMEPLGAEAEADRRIGSPESLAQAALAGLRISSFAARQPHLALVVAPLLLLPLCWGGCLLAAAWLASALSDTPHALSAGYRAILFTGCYLAGYALHALLSALFYIRARRHLCDTSWAWIPCVLLSAVAAYTFFHFGSKGDHSGQSGSFVAGIAAAPDPLKLALAFGVVALLELRHTAKLQQRLRSAR